MKHRGRKLTAFSPGLLSGRRRTRRLDLHRHRRCRHCRRRCRYYSYFAHFSHHRHRHRLRLRHRRFTCT